MQQGVIHSVVLWASAGVRAAMNEWPALRSRLAISVRTGGDTDRDGAARAGVSGAAALCAAAILRVAKKPSEAPNTTESARQTTTRVMVSSAEEAQPM